jgi:hypothetical protein
MSFFKPRRGTVSIATTHTSAAREHFLNALTAVADSNHHLWWNRRTLWVAFCIIRNGHRQERVRRSLATSDYAVARQRRDALFRTWAENVDGELSLRFRH